jgi:hypothetical protein
MLELLKPITPLSVRRVFRNAQLISRRPTSRLRVLPDFLIIGAQRSGTSSLFKYLAAHPCVRRAIRKEVSFFSRWYSKGEDWYRSHFPTSLEVRLLQSLRASRILTFEASPSYFYHPHAGGRASQLIPEAKIVVLLRNPIDRAFSDYRHMVRLGYETLSFEEAIEKEAERIQAERERLLEDHSYDSPTFLRFSYYSRGLYADQLEVWFSHFPRERFFIARSEDFFARTGEIYGQILSFLGISQWMPPGFRNYSYLHTAQGGMIPEQGMTKSLRQELVKRYRPHNRRLMGLLDWGDSWGD